MARYKLTIEYNGTFFCGWQNQKDAVSVQETIEQALYKFSGENLKVEGAGRTDAGVHASGQVAHIDLTKPYQPYRVRDALNAFLRDSGISIIQVEEVESNFHARFCAIERTYHYKILMRRSPSALYTNLMWHVPVDINMENLQIASNYFVGKHDFTSFRAAHCQANSPIRTLHSFEWHQEGEVLIATIKAPSFLHNQVRIMVGALVDITKKGKDPALINEMLLARDRCKAGPTAPPHGLYLAHVKYED